MNATPDPQRDHAMHAPHRARLAWIIVGLAGAAIAASFLISTGGDAPAASNGSARAVPVTAAAVTRASVTQRGRYPGELDADTADVAAFYAGRLVSVRVRVGDIVKQGDVIAELDPVDAREQIAQARAQAKAAAAERNRAKVERDAAEAEVARLEPLARDKLISELEIDRQRARAKALGATVESASAGEAEAHARVRLLEKRVVESFVRAPFSGRIAERFVDPGATVTAGARLVRLVATSPLRIRFEVPEADVAQVSAGTMLTALTKGGDGKGVPARVTGVASEVSRERRVAIVEALIEAPPSGWLPGMYAEAIVDLRTIEQAITVPAPSVLSRLQPNGAVATGVFIAGQAGVARWVPVREITREGDRIAVEAELPPGTQVLVAGHVDLTDGSKILLATNQPDKAAPGAR
ncbi:MAG: efflux RND transporter periplasmic adaptor subunit [Kofleriaceae bacterium]